MEEEVSARLRCYPRDFLKRFGSSGGEAAAEAKKGELCELELSLGLSLGGCSEPDKERCFVRSPSNDALSSMFSLGNDVFPAAGAPLARACSLPTDAQEQKKRKELQSLKRLEAKRKRSEKRRPKPGETEERKDEVLEEELDDGQRPAAAAGPVNGVVPPPLPAPARVAGVQTVDGSKCFAPEAQVSIGSQGSGLSGISDFDCRLKRGFKLSGPKNCSEIKGLSTTTLCPKQSYSTTVDGKPATCGTEDDGSWKAPGRTISGVKKVVERDMMQEMPCVSTRGEGPNGRRIEGFLYKYRKGEEVRIVCVCHGRFFTPAEFVKHAGGGDVAHPLRHIVVNPSPVAFL